MASDRLIRQRALAASSAPAAATWRDRGALAIVLIFLLLLPISNVRVALSDEVQYVAYLHSLYFDGDLDFRNEYEHFAQRGLERGDKAVFNALLREDEYNPHPETGLLRNVAPVGSALMWAPGFVLADGAVRLANLFGADIPADGYSKPYIWAICMMSALYSLLGLLLTYRLARRWFSTFAAASATITVWLASPLIFYTFAAMPWSHATAFFLFAAFLTLWLDDHELRLNALPMQRSRWRWVALGVVGGLMTMAREQLALLLIIPAAEALLSYGLLLRRSRWREAGSLLLSHLLFLGTFIVALTPQLVAYQILNGRPGPSSTVSGKLHFDSPRFFHTLVDPAHGALLWSPVLALGLLGLVVLARRERLLAGLLLLGFVAQTYINGAIFTWHLSGSFGFRRLIECTPIFVLGLAALFEAVRPLVRRWPIGLLCTLLILWNFGLMAQWTVLRPDPIRKGLVWDGMVRYQVVEVPRQLAGKLDALLFDRCEAMINCGQR